MFIKSIVLDGFKSYGNRVEITGFDPEFNAITGLNGTGKSNILDSICFVLGITNLSNVRAGSLQELIYKHGQAGITKATVSITFDNRDKRQCPIGYDDHDEITVTRQVVMGGKNKYLINGINVQNKRVSDLFCSVQLNVNNPHFLIMQGRITKVLNMKPPEILSMVEEAAGTRMYEAKKQAAQKTIEKKDAKLKELNDIIIEDITPKLQKLQEERSHYQEFQKVNREVESVAKLHVAYTYTCFEKQATELSSNAQKLKDSIKAKKEAIEMNKKESIELDKKIDDLNSKLDEESGSVVKELEQELQTAEKEEASAAAGLAGVTDTLQSHLKRDQLLQRALNDDRAAFIAKNQEMEKISSMFESLRTASTTSEEQLAAAQQKFLAVSSGKEGDSQSLQDQLIAAKQAASEASTRISQSTMEMKHALERLKTLEREFGSSSSQYNKDTKTIGDQERELNRIQEQLSRSAYNEPQHRELTSRARQLTSTARSKRDQLEALSARLQRAHFDYTKPEPNFDPNRVYGTVARLIDVVDPVYCTALETAAGGKLYNVVVDNETTSKLLLQRGRLQQRTTIIPLNKISGHVIDQNTLKIAQDIGGGPEKVQLALNLVSYEPRLHPAMSWVFGSTLVCADLETARRVTFHPRVRRRAVTLDGDVFDPAGTLTGGARAKGGSQLLQLQDLKRLERETTAVELELQAANAELHGLQAIAERHQVLQQSYDMKHHELEVVKARLATTTHAQLHAEIEALRAQVRELTDAVERDRVTQKETVVAARELEAKVNDIKGHREREFKKAEEELKKAKKDAALHGAAWQQRSQELETLKLEVAELQQAVATSEQQLEQAKQQAASLTESRDEAKEEHARTKEVVKELQTRLKRQKTEMASRSSDVVKLAHKKEKLAKNNSELQLKIEEITFQIKELEGEVAKAQDKVKRLETEEPWILEERQHFGEVGGAYDFEARQAATAGARRQQLTARRDRLQRGLNTRAHALLEKEERQYTDLMRKKRIVEADRAKLVQVMAELDEKKRKTLVGACEQVNKDFASIFATLLPGAHARLTPPPGASVLDGLEVKVGFNNTWKESLGELSGGQRSLVALSLVLAMLLFKPAPLYILDEVDAALDLSHTQNIGIMLKEHFKHSQFIIVSLKDGMFNNANVLFRTRFVDGMSSVQRTVNARR